jgi:hypothetical protein
MPDSLRCDPEPDRFFGKQAKGLDQKNHQYVKSGMK